MTVELTKDERFAIMVALDELSNSGDWTEYYTEEQTGKVFKAMRTLKHLRDES